ncbi:hypothetical protein CH373_01510 [Leptospira perolatii]|uniref:DUF4340 domain-containing protein n=1 Tax=Leptospira perolatii TaxID=2023191 RepID=A0A2M9ZRZ9_9LEPT|nr:hypothetical protein [Leptospira perolatii]PJZ71218.1 hypothetical protein CH360_01510 [Leptospira perolatii]PJZ74751.1 hypothetical protein CH373_01510 [Leptospira perolatii]
MKNKILLLVLLLLALFGAFLFLEEKKEDVSEISYWEFPVSKIEYFPPSEQWLEKSGENFFTKEFSLTSKEEIKKGGAFITVSYFDKETNRKVEYEGGYNAENTFRDLGNLKIKDSEPLEEGKEPSSSLNVGEGAPTIIVYSGNSSRKVRIGKKHAMGSNRVILELGKPQMILSAYSYIFERFQKGPVEFRQKQLVNPGKELVKEISYLEEGGKYVKVENHPFQEKAAKKNFWRRTTGSIVFLDPNLGDSLHRAVTSLRVDLYPDEEKGAGLLIGNYLAPDDPHSQYALSTLKVKFTDGNELTFRFYKPTDLGDKKYTPVVRIWNGSFKESPAYVNEDTVRKIKESANLISAAAAYHKPDSTSAIQR